MSRRLNSLGISALCALGAAGAGALVASSGCTVLTNDALPDDAGTFEGGGDAASVACTSCVDLECAGPWSVCLTDSRCVALRACDKDPQRNACFCSTPSPAPADDGGGADPLAAYQAFASCNDARTCGKCATDCTSNCAAGAGTTTAGSCGTSGVDAAVPPTDLDGGASDDAGDSGDPDSGVVTPTVDTCENCVSNQCGEAKKLCALGSECTAFLGCAYGCTDASCVDACGNSHASGRTSALELSSCTLTSCRSACGL